MLPEKIPFSEEGFAQLLAHYESNDGYEDLVAIVKSFTEQMIGEAEEQEWWYEEEHSEDDPYYEPFEGEMTLDAAIGYLDAPGWGFTTNACDLISQFCADVNWFIFEYDPECTDRSQLDSRNSVLDVTY